MPELMPRVSLRHRLRSRRQPIARENFRTSLAVQSRRLQAQLFGQSTIEHHQTRRSHRRRLHRRIKQLRQRRIRVIQSPPSRCRLWLVGRIAREERFGHACSVSAKRRLVESRRHFCFRPNSSLPSTLRAPHTTSTVSFSNRHHSSASTYARMSSISLNTNTSQPARICTPASAA